MNNTVTLHSNFLSDCYDVYITLYIFTVEGFFFAQISNAFLIVVESVCL